MTDEITDLTNRARTALTRDCAMSLAREVVKLRFIRGDFTVLQVLDMPTLESLAIALLKEPK